MVNKPARREIHRKDVAAIWASGCRAGFYAVGEIETNPSKKPLNPEQENTGQEVQMSINSERRVAL
jgi:hypothetical protein